MLNIYRASAGSGKTYRLTQDYIHLLFDPQRERTHRRILAVTFTNKATEEMKSRILIELHKLAQSKESDYRLGLKKSYNLNDDEVNKRARKILTTILNDYSSFSISTIDRFFQQVIRSFAREIGVHGGYNLELNNDEILTQSVDNLFLDLSKSENKLLLSWLTQFAEERIEESENWNPRRSIEELGREIFKESYQHKAEDTNKKLHNREFLLEYRRKLREIETAFVTKVNDAAEMALNVMSKHGLTHEDFAYKETERFEKLIKGKYEVGKRFIDFSEDVTKCYTKTKPQSVKNTIEMAYADGLQDYMLKLIRYLQEDIIIYNSVALVLKHISTLGILSDLALQIKKLTEEQNTMLISDANMLLNRIIDNGDTPFVYEKTGMYIDHFMIDEFQDTSVLQWENFFPLISNSLSSGKFNLLVGDVKQSIYRWRNSDWKLLDEQVQVDFRAEQLHEENLDTNWRSDRNIVDFNNSFFCYAASYLQEKLNLGLIPVLPVYPSLLALTEKIEHAYAQLHQKTSTRAGEGRVNVSFIPRDDNEDGWKSESLNRLPFLLEDVQLRGYQPGDVAILVRTNAEAQAVIQKLLNFKTTDAAKPGYSYDIMGNEGLMIVSATSVRFVLGILSLLVNPTDSIQKTIVSYEYARARLKLEDNDALNLCFKKSNEKKSFSQLFTDEENNQLSMIQHYSLYDMVEKIISLFEVGTWRNEAVFIQAFQDVIFKFTTGKTTDVYSFLKWWEKNGEKQNISTPENNEAFRIMTVHKAKGLDFKVVIMPFCDWDFDKKSGYNKNVLWCEPKQAPFNDLPLLPVEYSSKLGNSIFAENYFDELMHQYIDNLNVAYVAFTRAKHELYCFTPTPKTEPVSVDKISSLGGMMKFCFQYGNVFTDKINLTEKYDVEKLDYNLGEPITVEKKEFKSGMMSEKISVYPSVSSADRLHIRHQSLDYWLENQNLTDSHLNYGLIMHDILKKIKYKTDQENAINEMIREGRINIEDGRLVNESMQSIWDIPETAQWFATDVKVLNEATILTSKGNLYRPDRVVFKDNLATVIDYKFGDQELDKYKLQVKSYMDLIEEMGYKAKGYLCYVSLHKVVSV